MLQDRWECSLNELRDLKILAVYSTHNGYMVALFLMGAHRLFFLDQDGIALESLRFSSLDTEIKVLDRTRKIATLLGTTAREDLVPIP